MINVFEEVQRGEYKMVGVAGELGDNNVTREKVADGKSK